MLCFRLERLRKDCLILIGIKLMKKVTCCLFVFWLSVGCILWCCICKERGQENSWYTCLMVVHYHQNWNKNWKIDWLIHSFKEIHNTETILKSNLVVWICQRPFIYWQSRYICFSSSLLLPLPRRLCFCLFISVCLSVCWEDNSKSHRWYGMKFSRMDWYSLSAHLLSGQPCLESLEFREFIRSFWRGALSCMLRPILFLELNMLKPKRSLS